MPWHTAFLSNRDTAWHQPWVPQRPSVVGSGINLGASATVGGVCHVAERPVR